MKIVSYFAIAVFALTAQDKTIVWSPVEKPIAEQIQGLRGLPDGRRAEVTKQLALRIRALPASDHKLILAHSLADLVTEGDAGQITLQETGVTLAESLHEQEATSKGGMPEEPYVTLAQLIRYANVRVAMNSRPLQAAMTRLEADEERRQKADFTLTDLSGKTWHLKDARGSVVLVNFWATWCPPCRKEMPYLDALYRRFRKQGLVVLAISDEDGPTVKPFLAKANVAFPVLLDPGGLVHNAMAVDGIPKSFVYDRQGRLVAQAMDMRTPDQFLGMLSKAGLK